MDPVQQITWFYDQAEGMAGTPGEIAANVERPREDLRGKYAAVERDAREYYAVLAEGAAGSLGARQNACATNRDVPPSAAAEPSGDLGRAILAAARRQFGQDYVWGGGDHYGPTSGGFDCSGLTMYAVYQATGGAVALGHQTNVQVNDPSLQKVAWEDRAPGDLLFFGAAGNYYHVSIYSGEHAGIPMHYEAQQDGVPVGEFPVPGASAAEVRRVRSNVEDQLSPGRDADQ